LLDAESLSRAIAGSTYVVHTASPYFNPVNEEDVVKPAVEGTMAVLKACSASNVKRLVITSSCAAIYFTADKDRPD
jgi:nucleoside-diphosphate-sugar epimerase